MRNFSKVTSKFYNHSDIVIDCFNIGLLEDKKMANINPDIAKKLYDSIP